MKDIELYRIYCTLRHFDLVWLHTIKYSANFSLVQSLLQCLQTLWKNFRASWQSDHTPIHIKFTPCSNLCIFTFSIAGCSVENKAFVNYVQISRYTIQALQEYVSMNVQCVLTLSMRLATIHCTSSLSMSFSPR